MTYHWDTYGYTLNDWYWNWEWLRYWNLDTLYLKIDILVSFCVSAIIKKKFITYHWNWYPDGDTNSFHHWDWDWYGVVNLKN